VIFGGAHQCPTAGHIIAGIPEEIADQIAAYLRRVPNLQLTQHRIERQPAVPTPAAGEPTASNADRAAAAIQGARRVPTPYRIQRMDAALRTSRTPRPGRAGQLAQPGRQEFTPNVSHALFACVEISHRYIVCHVHKALTASTGGCEHLLAEGLRHLASVRVACGVNTGGPFSLRSWHVIRPTLPPGSPGDPFPGTPRRHQRLGQGSAKSVPWRSGAGVGYDNFKLV